MNIYNYNSKTREYLSTAQAVLDPLEDGKYLIPRNATTTAPPNCEDGTVAVYVAGAWKIIEDHRGEIVYSIDTAKSITISELGNLPDNVTSLIPPDYPLWDASSGVWAQDEALQVADMEESARDKRNTLLVMSDWTQLSDCVLDDDTKALWVTYRQALRDVPQQDEFPANITWPTKPE